MSKRIIEDRTAFDNGSIDQDIQRAIDHLRKHATDDRICVFLTVFTPPEDVANDEVANEIQMFNLSLYRGTPPHVAAAFINASLDLLEESMIGYVRHSIGGYE
jgi:hypothetical protein